MVHLLFPKKNGATSPTVTEMKNEQEGASEIDLSQE